jgi:hypothetical protein
MSSIFQTPQFLNGKVYLEISTVQFWYNIITKLMRQASGQLLVQLTKCQTDLNAVLALPVNPAIAVGLTIVPITIVVEIQNTLAVFSYQFSGYPADPNAYMDLNTQIDGVYIQFSSAFYNGAYTTKIVVVE